VIRKRARALFLLSTCLALGTSFPAPGQRELAFTDPAPLKQLLSRGVTAGSVESGLSFAASLTGGADGIRAGPFMLRIPGAPKPLELVLERPRIEAIELAKGLVADAPSPNRLVEDLSTQNTAAADLRAWK